MPDITLCLNKGCKKAKKCYRFMVEPDEYQSYSHFDYKEDCKYYMPLEVGMTKYNAIMSKIIKKGKPVAETLIEMLDEAGKYKIKDQ